MQKISVAILNDIIRYLDNDLIEFYTDNYQKNKYLKESLFDYVSYYVQTDILDKDPEGLSKLLTLKMRARTRRKMRYLQKCKDDVDLCICSPVNCRNLISTIAPACTSVRLKRSINVDLASSGVLEPRIIRITSSILSQAMINPSRIWARFSA